MAEQLEEQFASLDDLEKEFQESQKQAKEPEKGAATSQFVVPEKFKDKSIEDVIKSYTDLEREYGRRSNEIGELRKGIDSLLELKLEEKEKSVKAPPKEISAAEVFDNPRHAIEQVIQDNPELREIKNELRLEKLRAKQREFETNHSDWKDIMSSTDFQEWVQSSPTRTRMFVEADRNYDYDTGGELLTLFKEVKAVNTKRKEQEAQEKTEAELQGSTTIGRSGVKAPVKVYNREDLIELRRHNPAKYDQMYPEIYRAYQEGRVKSRNQ